MPEEHRAVPEKRWVVPKNGEEDDEKSRFNKSIQRHKRRKLKDKIKKLGFSYSGRDRDIWNAESVAIGELGKVVIYKKNNFLEKMESDETEIEEVKQAIEEANILENKYIGLSRGNILDYERKLLEANISMIIYPFNIFYRGE